MATITTARETIETINPATEAKLRSYQADAPAAVENKLERAHQAFLKWRATRLDERASVLRNVAKHLRGRKGDIAKLATLEMGKPILEAQAEVEKCAWCCDYYAEHAAGFLADEVVVTNAAQSYIAYRPIGPVLAVMPWNFPFWQVFRFAAPALMAGNVGVLKHASNVTECALEIGRIFAASGLPEGGFEVLVLPSKYIAGVIDDRRIAAVTLTGSEGAGIAVASGAGHALKKTVLELGGSDAFIVLADADLDAAAKTAVKARFQNAGQSCIAAKRFIVEAPVYEDFIERFTAETKKLRIGDPLAEQTQIGPMARGDLRDDLQKQIDLSVQAGAKVVMGGKARPGQGYYYEPTILRDVTDVMPAFREETFGPAAAVIRADDVDHAIALANDSKFGLGGNLWTNDIERARRLATRLESGGVFINGMTASDPRLPFGGVKHSGYGRELSAFGLREFVNIQTVWIGPASTPTVIAD